MPDGEDERTDRIVPEIFPLLKEKQTPHRRQLLNISGLFRLLLLVQVIMGVITAHYGVEGQAFYGFPLAKYTAIFNIREHGIFRSLFSGLQHRGWQRDYIMLRQYRDMNLNFSGLG